MTSLVFGASGSLGSHLVQALLERKTPVLAISRAQPKFAEHRVQWQRLERYEDFNPSGIAWTSAYLAFGVFSQHSLHETSVKQVADAIDANLLSQILLVRRLVCDAQSSPQVRRDIIFIGSTSAYTGFAGSSVYCATKFALRGLVESLNAEWSESDIRFWLASMGSMDNTMGQSVKNVRVDELLSPLEVARDIVNATSRTTNAFQPEIMIRRRRISK